MRNKVIIQKMLRYANKLSSYCQDVSYDDFCHNDMLVEACVFNLSQIGELVNKLDANFKQEHPQIPWPHIYGLRNRIIHDYEGVNLKLIWEILSDDIPELREHLKSIQNT